MSSSFALIVIGAYTTAAVGSDCAGTPDKESFCKTAGAACIDADGVPNNKDWICLCPEDRGGTNVGFASLPPKPCETPPPPPTTSGPPTTVPSTAAPPTQSPSTPAPPGPFGCRIVKRCHVNGYMPSITKDPTECRCGMCEPGYDVLPDERTCVELAPISSSPIVVSPSTTTPITLIPSAPPVVTSVPSTPQPTAFPPTPVPPTAVPNTAEPTTGEPTTGEPTTGEPTSGVPTTGLPVVVLATGVPRTGKPTTGKPTTGRPTTGVPNTAIPGTFEPVTERPRVIDTGVPNDMRGGLRKATIDQDAIPAVAWFSAMGTLCACCTAFMVLFLRRLQRNEDSECGSDEELQGLRSRDDDWGLPEVGPATSRVPADASTSSLNHFVGAPIQSRQCSRTSTTSALVARPRRSTKSLVEVTIADDATPKESPSAKGRPEGRQVVLTLSGQGNIATLDDAEHDI